MAERKTVRRAARNGRDGDQARKNGQPAEPDRDEATPAEPETAGQSGHAVTEAVAGEHRPSVNQVRHEPIPASRQEHRRQDDDSEELVTRQRTARSARNV